MTKNELIETIIECSIDPMSGEYPEDYLFAKPITLAEAKTYLSEQRAMERDCDLEPDECLPAEVTPKLYMEAMNCYTRKMKFEARVERLAEWITENDCVCEYDNYYLPEHDDAVDVIPVDFIANSDTFPFTMKDGRTPDHCDMLMIGLNSAKTFNPDHEYCWYDKEKNQLFSTDTPFEDGIIDAEAFARHILLDADAFGYMFDNIIDDDDIIDILGCTKEEYINECM